jgi:hypothetical protein
MARKDRIAVTTPCLALCRAMLSFEHVMNCATGVNLGRSPDPMQSLHDLYGKNANVESRP